VRQPKGKEMAGEEAMALCVGRIAADRPYITSAGAGARAISSAIAPKGLPSTAGLIFLAFFPRNL
jgi:hypothetical protein